MGRRTGLTLFLLLSTAFLALNRSAYLGYFQDDDINSMTWTRWGSSLEYLKGALTPIYAHSFRAVGFYYYHVAERAFGLDFPKYIAVIHGIHLLNVWMLWTIMRRLGSALAQASAACAFFALHAALFETVWMPAYVFDLLCGTLCLLSLLLWMRGDWVLSFASFWLAYKSKELAVMLPVVLAVYEVWFGTRRWLRLAPFAAASMSFTVQALLVHPEQAPDYAFHFTRTALAATAPFYAHEVFLVPYLAFLLPVAAWLAPNRRTWFGLAMTGLFFFPLLWLPGRVFGAYCYVPFTGLAIALAGLAERATPAAIAACLLLWLPLDVHWVRSQSRDTLRRDAQAREWITTLRRFAERRPNVTGFVYRGLPEGFHDWGVAASVRYVFHALDATVPAADSVAGTEQLGRGRTAILNWDAVQKQLRIESP